MKVLKMLAGAVCAVAIGLFGVAETQAEIVLLDATQGQAFAFAFGDLTASDDGTLISLNQNGMGAGFAGAGGVPAGAPVFIADTSDLELVIEVRPTAANIATGFNISLADSDEDVDDGIEDFQFPGFFFADGTPDADGFVTLRRAIDDFASFNPAFQQPASAGNGEIDFGLNGFAINQADPGLDIEIRSFVISQIVPEPSSLALTALFGGIFAARRRKS